MGNNPDARVSPPSFFSIVVVGVEIFVECGAFSEALTIYTQNYYG